MNSMVTPYVPHRPRRSFGPTLEQVRDVLAAMPADTDVERRDRGFDRVDPSETPMSRGHAIPLPNALASSQKIIERMG
jgi:hypothetical protein